MQIYSFLFKWKKNCLSNFKKKVSLQFVGTMYVCSNQLVARFGKTEKELYVADRKRFRYQPFVTWLVSDT